MKNFFMVAIGFVLVSSAVISFSNASRDAYHSYLTSQVGSGGIHYTNRMGVRERILKTELVRNLNEKPTKNLRNFRNTRENQQVALTLEKNTFLQRSLRTFSTALRTNAWKKPLTATGISHVTALPTKIKTFETFKNEAFSLKIPEKAKPVETATHTFAMQNGEFEIRIKHFESGTCDDAYGFTGCAIKIAKNENDAQIPGQGKLFSQEKIVRQSGESDVLLDRLNVKLPTYTEKFTTTFLDGKDYILYRYLVKDLNDGAFLIETKTLKSEGKYYLSATKQIFDSFRIYDESATTQETEKSE